MPTIGVSNSITITRQTKGGLSPLLAVGDIAAEYGVQVGTVKQWIHRGRFVAPVARTSGGAVYLRDEVAGWFAGRR